VGIGTSDDAGIYKLSYDLAIIQTVDFFTPIVDDPYSFGQIAAANSLSDVYAMGGKPITAMNIICFPVQSMEISVLKEALAGGLDKIKEAGALLVGGHSVEDEEFKYGLSVTGVVHPDLFLTNKGARKGDSLILTKPIGTGIINTAIKGNIADEELISKVISVMSSLNSTPAGELKSFDVRACTDVTGFGLLGHACEMIEDGNVGLKIDANKVPLIQETINFARMGIVPAGAHRNRDFRKEYIIGADQIDTVMMDVLFDPQTSGGLLIAVEGDQTEGLLGKLRNEGIEDAALIGEFVEEPAGKIILGSG
jgi:selenide,water dikinase